MSKFAYLAASYIIRADTKIGTTRFAFDLEADGLADAATKAHCIVVADLDGDRIDEYGPNQIAAALEHLARADYLVGHNIVGYDLPLLRRLYDWAPAPECTIIDTLVVSRLVLPNLSDLDDKAAAIGDRALGKLRGRYSIEAWGARLGLPKIGADIEDWSVWTPEMQARCVGDVAICKTLCHFLQPDGYSQQAIALEHRAAAICNRITADGVPFDTVAAAALREKWTARRSTLEAQLQQQFPGTNLNSRPQIGALLEARGWTPEKRTEKTRQPKIDDELLETIPELYPEFTGLAEHYTLGRRLGQLSNGKRAWCKNLAADGRIHGGLVHIGTPHSRAKHLEPNLAQVPNPKKGKLFAAECRALFRAHDDRVFVTADQAGLQDRGFANYLADFDGGAYAKTFLNGAANDTHWTSAAALGLVSAGTTRDKQNKVHEAIREGSKRFRYAFLYGVGLTTAGRIISDIVRAVHQIDSNDGLQKRFFNGSVHPNEAALKQIGKQALNAFEAGTPGLRRLRESLQAQARQHGWLPGLDGRRVPVRALHSALNFIVTSSEAIICKRWLVRVYDELCTRFHYGWDGDVVIVLWVHDELVACCRPAIAEKVGEIMVRHAREPAEFYRFKVPLDAEYKIGRSWAGEPLDDAAAGEAQPVIPADLDEINTGSQREGIEPIADVTPPWATLLLIKVPPGSAEFEAILALSEEDRATVRPEEASRGNGHNRHPTSQSNGKARCPFHEDHDPSLELYSDGHYHCYVCGAHGATAELPEAAQASAPAPDAAQSDTDTLELGMRLWQAAVSICGTPAERYLREIRKLDLTMLPDINEVLRFHPRCPFNGNAYPCVIALFRDVETNEAAGIHRIALTADAEKIDRRMLGSWSRPRAVKLRPVGEDLLIGEGIETSIAGEMKICWRSALWALGSAGAIGRLPLISGVKKLGVLVDREASGVGIEAARRCATRWRYARREVVLLIPRQAGTDFNDIVKERTL